MRFEIVRCNMNERHQRFIKRLTGSPDGVFIVARWFGLRGYSVRVPAIRVCPPDGDPNDYLDDGDLFVAKLGDPERRIEVKTRSFNFTGAEDWPFKDKESIVSNAAAIDRMDPIAEAFFIVSNDLKAAGIIMGETKGLWERKIITPKTTDAPELFYVCSIDLMKFTPL